MIVIAVGTGLRRGDLVALRWADVNLEDGSIRVRHRDGFTTKGNRERRIPVVETPSIPSKEWTRNVRAISTTLSSQIGTGSP
jgi:integrase